MAVLVGLIWGGGNGTQRNSDLVVGGLKVCLKVKDHGTLFPGIKAFVCLYIQIML